MHTETSTKEYMSTANTDLTWNYRAFIKATVKSDQALVKGEVIASEGLPCG